MKKRLVMMAMGALLALGAFGLMGCSGGGNAGSGEADSAAGTVPTGEVSVYSREDGSGTRGAFVELMGIEEKDASGEKVTIGVFDKVEVEISVEKVRLNFPALGYASTCAD